MSAQIPDATSRNAASRDVYERSPHGSPNSSPKGNLNTRVVTVVVTVEEDDVIEKEVQTALRKLAKEHSRDMLEFEAQQQALDNEIRLLNYSLSQFESALLEDEELEDCDFESPLDPATSMTPKSITIPCLVIGLIFAAIIL